MENNNHELINLISSLVEEYFNSKEFELKIACIARKNSYHPCDDWKPMSLEEACNDR